MNVPAHLDESQSTWEHIHCNLCHANDSTLYLASTLPSEAHSNWAAYNCTSGGYGHHGPIVRCNQCGLIYASPRRSSGEVLEIYEAVEDPLYQEERQGRILTFEHHLKPLEQFTGPPQQRRLVDVGAYIGVFVEIARSHGWDAVGIEPSAWAVTQAQANELPVQLGTLETADFPPDSFHVVTMWDVIEHVLDPYKTLLAAWRVLKPGGTLVVHTMDIDSLFSRLMGKRWPWYMEMHLFYFSRRTMAQMLQKAGFEIAWMGAQGRYLQSGYLASRMTALFPRLGRPLEALIRRFDLQHYPLRINLGDLFTTYARKPR